MAASSWVPLVVATILSGHGWRKKSLSPSGAMTAFAVGYLMLSGGTYAFGATLIVFYLVGSRATKYGKKQKSKLEDHYHEAGYRTGWQVLSNSGTAVLATALFVQSSPQAALSALLGLDVAKLLGSATTPDYNRGPNGWCPLDVTVAHGWSRFFVGVVLGHFACCLGDTLASELGILAGPPRLVTTFKTVPRGTNGAISLGGTIASVVGGGIVGLTLALSLMLENPQCAGSEIILGTIAWGMLGGGFGSLVDSVLGATVQQTRYSEGKKRIVERADSETRTVAGLDILTNNQVNVVSSFLTAAGIGWASTVGVNF